MPAREFPAPAEACRPSKESGSCVKSDVLAGTMTFSSSKDTMANVVTLPVSRVREILALNRQGKKVEQLQHADDIRPAIEETTYRSGGGQHHPLRPGQAPTSAEAATTRGRGGTPLQNGSGKRRRGVSAERPARPAKVSRAVLNSGAATTVRSNGGNGGSLGTAVTAKIGRAPAHGRGDNNQAYTTAV